MFIAETTEGIRISALSDDEELLKIKSIAKTGAVRCPECKAPMVLKKGAVRRPHFSHKSQQCNYKYGEPESAEHSEGKYLIAQWLRSLFPDDSVEIEYKVVETQQRTDVMLMLQNGKRYAFEFQCASISTEEWQERHELYKKAGIVDIWILGVSRINLRRKYVRVKEMDYTIFEAVPVICAGRRSLVYLNVENKSLVAVNIYSECSKSSPLMDSLIRFDHVPVIGTESGLKAYDRTCAAHREKILLQREKIERNFKIDMKNWSSKPRFNILENEIILQHPEAFLYPQIKWKLFLYRVCIHKALGRTRYSVNPYNCTSLLMDNGYAQGEQARDDIKGFFDYLCNRGILIPLVDDEYAIIDDNIAVENTVKKPTMVYPLMACPSCGCEMEKETTRFIDKNYGSMSYNELYCKKCHNSYPLCPPLCKICKKPLVLKNWSKTPFWGCARYPDCKYTVNIEMRMPKSKNEQG